ncbi:MAG: choice-of-anchor N protein [Candidatus Krumholzibacteria bacterium]|nr:choice-of-anchor N protein [Candidatus Krumholzibacteria bacterium]
MVFWGSAMAVPRLQTYIVGSEYYNRYGLDRRSWITTNQYFDLKVVGYWESAPNMGGGNRGLLQSAPLYDYMDCYAVISVPRNQSGTIWINGVEITSFTGYRQAVPRGVHPRWHLPLTRPALFGKFNFSEAGRIDNSQMKAWHYNHGEIMNPGWGDEILLKVAVSGYDWVHFDAMGVNSRGWTYTNRPDHDASFYSNAVPEPGTLSLLGIGLLGMAPLLRKKKK